MMNIIRADSYRYRHQAFFWLTMLAALVSGLVFGWFVIADGRGEFDDMFIVPIFIILGIFISLSIGREYGDGVIRNKLIQGKSRLQIYTAKLVVSIASSLLMSGVFLIGFSWMAVSQILPYLNSAILWRAGLCFVMLNCVWATLFTVISMLISHKEISSVLNLTLIVVTMFGSYQVESILGQPEFINPGFVQVSMTPEEITQAHQELFASSYYVEVDSNGKRTYYKEGVEFAENIPNPRYISGSLRSLAQAVDNLSPSGQVNQYVAYLQSCLYSDDATLVEVDQKPWFPLYSLGGVVGLSLIGAVVFGKKEFK